MQAALDRCPSERIGFFTIGDSEVFLWDVRKADAVQEHMHRTDFCIAVKQARAGFEESLMFPNPVESTAG